MLSSSTRAAQDSTIAAGVCTNRCWRESRSLEKSSYDLSIVLARIAIYGRRIYIRIDARKVPAAVLILRGLRGGRTTKPPMRIGCSPKLPAAHPTSAG